MIAVYVYIGIQLHRESSYKRIVTQRVKKSVSKRFVVSSGSPFTVVPCNEVSTETEDKVATGMGQLPRTLPAQQHFITFFTKIWQVSQVFS